MVRSRRIARPDGPPLRRPAQVANRENRQQNRAEPIEKLYLDATDSASDWVPSTTAVLKMMLSFRFSAGLWSTIQDCDEVFNYWEPLHLLLFGKGLQTWEYSPLYAIRSYFYIGLHYLPASFLAAFFSHTKIAIFIIMRCLLSAFCAAAEFYLFKVICERYSIRIGRYYLLFAIFSTGMYIACSAFLPSTFSMVMNTFAVACYLREQWFLSIAATAVSALVGWPFAALLGLPVVIEMIFFRKELKKFIGYATVSGVLICFSLLYVDSYYFGKYVLAPLNIVLYNIFSEHGPNLYGQEPFSFYTKNLFLNYNLAVFLAAAAVPLAALAYLLTDKPELQRNRNTLSLVYWQRMMPLFLVALSMGAWFIVFAAQSHKEERFMFPIYPLIAFFAAIGLDAFRRLFERIWSGASALVWITVFLFIVISFSRSYALYRNYGAHMEVYTHFNSNMTDESALSRDFSNKKGDLRLCVGKEWYRFPSSFYLPEKVHDKTWNERGVRLYFLQSEFRGLLPKYYEEGSIPMITRQIPVEMNDLNKEEPSRYVPLDTCDFVIDLDVPSDMATPLEPRLSERTDLFKPLKSFPFLISSRSHWFHRAFFVPFISYQHVSMANYTLYISNRF